MQRALQPVRGAFNLVRSVFSAFKTVFPSS